MSNLIEYIIKEDKNGKEYGLKLNVKSGKLKRVNLKYAKKRQKRLIKERAYKELTETEEYIYIKNELKNSGYNGTYNEYIKERKKLIIKLKKDRVERGLKKSDKQIYNQATKAAFKFTGKKIITRYYFKFWCEGKICEYLCIENGYYDSKYEIELSYNEIFKREIVYIKKIFNNIVKGLLLFNTTGAKYYSDKKGKMVDDGFNGGEVIMVKMGTNKIIKMYNIPQDIINEHTILCDGKGKYIFKCDEYKNEEDQEIYNC